MAAREALSMLTTLSQASEYLPLALECRTQNQFNRLHIHLENILAPQEFVLLADLARRAAVSRAEPQLAREDWGPQSRPIR